MFREIGAYDAKTKLPELLRLVQEGQRFTITLRGKPIADLIPSPGAKALTGDPVDAMLAFERVTGIDADDVSDWIAEGRR
jgi:prevent-host-death family protein